MPNIDASITNADWTKNSWDLPKTIFYYEALYGIELREYVAKLLTLPVSKAMPLELRNEFAQRFPDLFDETEQQDYNLIQGAIDSVVFDKSPKENPANKPKDDDESEDEMKVLLIPASSIGVLTKTLSMLEQKADRGGVPPKGAQVAAKRGLALRKQFGRGGTMVGVARARDISNGVNLSESTVRRMKAYFDRHEVDKQGKDWDNAEKPSNGKIAWLLWGGDAGRSWATRMVKKWNREDGRTKSVPRWLPNGDEITELSQLAAVLNVDVKTAAWCVIDSKDAPVGLLEKALRFVRTRAGAIHYGQPIGTPIRKDRESWRGLIYEVTKESEGITLDFATGTRPQIGYVVAERGNNLEIPEDQFFDKSIGIPKLMEWVRKHEKELDKENAHLGVWHDKENKEVVFDVSFVIEDYDEAYKFGERNNQQSMYDIVNDDLIFIGGTGDRAALEQTDGKNHFGKARQEVFGNDRRRIKGVVRKSNRSSTEVRTKDVFAADRTSGNQAGVSGAVAAPFEILKEPVRRQTRFRQQTRDRVRRMLDNWDKHQESKDGFNE
jgi:hypothetical protein